MSLVLNDPTSDCEFMMIIILFRHVICIYLYHDLPMEILCVLRIPLFPRRYFIRWILSHI